MCVCLSVSVSVSVSEVRGRLGMQGEAIAQIGVRLVHAHMQTPQNRIAFVHIKTALQGCCIMTVFMQTPQNRVCGVCMKTALHKDSLARLLYRDLSALLNHDSCALLMLVFCYTQ